MQTTRPLLGASRLPLTTKRGNKDYYKGTRQAFVPGTSTRSGLPGRHTPHQAGKFQILDEKIRYYVPPPPSLYHIPIQQTQLKPYMTNMIDPKVIANRLPPLAPLGPTPHYRTRLSEDFGPAAEGVRLKGSARRFRNAYAQLSVQEKEALKVKARREWWAKYQANIPVVRSMEENGAFKDQKEGDEGEVE